MTSVVLRCTTQVLRCTTQVLRCTVQVLRSTVRVESLQKDDSRLEMTCLRNVVKDIRASTMNREIRRKLPKTKDVLINRVRNRKTISFL